MAEPEVWAPAMGAPEHDVLTELTRLADEQAALRRVAVLVACRASQTAVLASIAREVGEMLGAHEIRIFRYDIAAELAAEVVAYWSRRDSEVLPVGARQRLDGENVTGRVYRTRRPTRMDDYATARGPLAEHLRQAGISAAVGAPIMVDGRVWGAMTAAVLDGGSLPADAETRIGGFTELIGTAIANAQSRAEVERLAEQQTALRSVATLVAQGGAPQAIFNTVLAQMSRLLGAQQAGLVRATGPGEITVMALHGTNPEIVDVGARVPLDGDSVSRRVLRTRRSTRLNLADLHTGTIAGYARREHVHVAVGAPIVVDGALWGAVTASWTGDDRAPDDAEDRLAEFAALVNIAIANADSREQLTASRTRLLTASDDARRRVVGDLHDGAQQRLVHAIITLKLAQRALDQDHTQARALLAEALSQAEQSNAELRELAHGILPAVLTRGGLRAGVDALIRRCSLPVRADVTGARLAPELEASAYFFVAEALTNAVKHAQAELIAVSAHVVDGALYVEVRDDGRGGADPHGHGLQGLADRAGALGGRLRVQSTNGHGTVLTMELPLS